MKKLLLAISLFSFVVSNAQYFANIPQRDTTGVDTIIRPFTALNDYFTRAQAVEYPLPGVANQHTKDLYFRITAEEIVRTNFSGLDSWFTLAGGRNQKVVFRIVTIDDSYTGNSTGGAKLAYPAAWHTTMQGEANPDFIIDGVWFPNYNSTTYKSNWRSLVNNVVSHMKNTIVAGTGNRTQWQILAAWDLGGVGHYGEFHRFTSSGGSWPFPTGTTWTTSSLQEIINAQTDVVTDRPMILNVNVTTSNSTMPAGFPSWCLTKANGWGVFGLRYDNSGNKNIFDFEYTNNNGSENGIIYKTEIANRWKVAPVLAEPIQFGFSAAGQVDYYSIKNEYPALHVSMVENANNIENGATVPLAVQNLFRSMGKLLGYRWSFKTVSQSDSIRPGSTFTNDITFTNTGITPTYDHVTVTYYLYQGATLVKQWNSNFHPFMVLPGSVTDAGGVTMSGTFSGLYDMYVKFNFDDGYWPYMPLQANVARTSDGKYRIRSGIAVANSITPPPPPPPPVNNPPAIQPIGNYTDTLPKNVDTIYAQLNDIDEDNISYTWVQNSGPNTATQGTASGTVNSVSGVEVSNRLSGLIAGTYQFTINANDGHGGLANRTVNVFVVDSIPIIVPPPPPPKTYNPPVLQKLTDTTIQAPSDSAFLRVHVISKDTAIESVLWVVAVGNPYSIVNSADSSTKITGLTPLNISTQKNYRVDVYVTDKAGNTVHDWRFIKVLPIEAEIPPGLPGPDKPPAIVGPKKSF